MRQLTIQKQLTDRNQGNLSMYLAEVTKQEMVSIDKEVELARKIKQGDKASRDALVKANLRFVISVAKQYQNRGLPLSDLINEGNIGLITAAEKFDETKGFKFITYAVWWIRNAIIQSLTEHAGTVRLPLNKLQLKGRVDKIVQELENQLVREPTNEEIAEVSKDLSLDKISLSRSLSGKAVSGDQPLSTDNDTTYLDWELRQDESIVFKELLNTDLKIVVYNILQKLKPREAYILTNHYGLNGLAPRSLSDIAEEMKLSHERVRQIHQRSLIKLRASRRVKKAKEYL